MAKAILDKVGELPCTRMQFKKWRPDLTDVQIKAKMTSLPSIIIDDTTEEEANNCKKDFETCLGTSVSVKP